MRTRGESRRVFLCGVAAAALLAGSSLANATAGGGRAAAGPDVSEDSLRGHLSFLASDLLEGRDTPSRGLDLAAEYLAAQFRRAGLEAPIDGGYFQIANWKMQEPGRDGFSLSITAGGKSTRVGVEHVGLGSGPAASVENAPAAIVNTRQGLDVALLPEELKGRVVVAEAAPVPADRTERFQAIRRRQEFAAAAQKKGAIGVIFVQRSGVPLRGVGRLVNPESPPPPPPAGGGFPQLTVVDPELTAWYDQAAAQESRISYSLPATAERPVVLKNVVGVLRGSDPVLKNSYVMVSAHYDHVGMREGAGDQIYNGANDDGSGTVGVIELASALSRLPARPKRSIVFVAFFGEEKGLLGSRWYGAHPVFPLKDTVAQVNLEQIGRTDSSEGPQVNRAGLTGYDYSEVGKILSEAGQATGVTVYHHPMNSDAFFNRSDNASLAEVGIPAHTLCTAFVYPDYHQPGDHWEKIDYANMARVVRTVARGLEILGNRTEAPAWSETNPRASRYLAAWKKLRAAQ